MEIVTFELSRYRSIKKTEKLSLGNPTVIVGPNNEGKSNIIRALVLCVRFICSSPRETVLTRSWHYDWLHDFPIALQQSMPKGQSVFQIELRLTEAERSTFLKRVGSKNNGTLKIVLRMGGDSLSFEVLKQGSGKEAMQKGVPKIREFLREHLRIQYIPAVRTADEARRVIHQLIEDDLSQIESTAEYKDAIKAIGALQKPIFDRLSQKLTGSLKAFLPNIKNVKILAEVEARRRALRSNYDIQIDDGTATSLDKKGDGVQSLAALALMKHAVTPKSDGLALVLAIEEPESHLHPSAIHRLQEVIADLSREHQVIISTHCPLFVDRRDVSKNILVNNKRAHAARDVQQIRDALGVRVSDNLRSAELVLIVEGETDRKILRRVFQQDSPPIARALDSGVFAIDSLAGASNLTYKLQQVRDSLCQAVVMLDNDQAADQAKKNAMESGLLAAADVFQMFRATGKETELEDLVMEDLYASAVLSQYAVDIKATLSKEGRLKWSDRLQAIAGRQGHPLSDDDVTSIKIAISSAVDSSPNPALKPGLRGPIDTMIASLEARLAASP